MFWHVLCIQYVLIISHNFLSSESIEYLYTSGHWSAFREQGNYLIKISWWSCWCFIINLTTRFRAVLKMALAPAYIFYRTICWFCCLERMEAMEWFTFPASISSSLSERATFWPINCQSQGYFTSCFGDKRFLKLHKPSSIRALEIMHGTSSPYQC